MLACLLILSTGEGGRGLVPGSVCRGVRGSDFEVPGLVLGESAGMARHGMADHRFCGFLSLLNKETDFKGRGCWGGVRLQG